MFEDDEDTLGSGNSDLTSSILSSVGVATSLIASAGSGTVHYTTASVPPIPLSSGPSATTLLLLAAVLVGGFFLIKDH